MHYKEKELACQSNPKLTPEQKNKAGLKVNSMRLIHPYALHGPSTGETRNILRAYVKGKAWGAAGTQNSLSSLTGSHRATSLSVAYFGNLPTPKLSRIWWAHEQKLSLERETGIVFVPHVKTYAFSTPKGSIRGSGDPYISNLGHRESSPSSQGKYKLSPSCVQLGICSPSQSDIDNMVQAWKLGSILSIWWDICFVHATRLFSLVNGSLTGTDGHEHGVVRVLTRS